MTSKVSPTTNYPKEGKEKTTLEQLDDLAFLKSIENLPALEKHLRCSLKWGNGVSHWEITNKNKPTTL